MFPEYGPRTRVRPGAVPETRLWGLYHRAMEARRDGTVLPDPVAVDLLDELDHPFEVRGGPPPAVLDQAQALRARCFDDVVRAFLAGHPGATVVDLGGGLDTRFWRADDGLASWLVVDRPEVIALRRRTLPAHPRVRVIPGRAEDPRWIREIGPARGRGVLVTAEGVLMYLTPGDARALIAACADELPGGALVFDSVPRWFARLTRLGLARTRGGRRVPPMPFALDPGERRYLAELHPAITEVADLPLPPGRGPFFRFVLPRAGHVPGLRGLRPTVTVLRFGGPAAEADRAGP